MFKNPWIKGIRTLYADHGDSNDRVVELTSRKDVIQGLQDSVSVLMDHLAKGYYVYGISNT